MKHLSRLILSLTALIASNLPAMAAEPKPTLLGLQEAASPSMLRLHSFHDNILMWIITGIVIFVAVLLVVVIVRFNAKTNPTPSKTTHNVFIEVIWTLVPLLILILIALPSFKLLYYLDRTENPDMTLKAIGYQWGWTYQYPDYEGIEYNADMITDEDMAKFVPDNKGRRLLETYNPVVLPAGKNIQVITTANDVIHSWTVPAFGMKKDAVPGRLNEMWTRIERTGVYYGQCSEICGINHAFMPIMVYAVTPDEFTAWTECVKAESAATFPARECATKLGFDKYRDEENRITVDHEDKNADNTAEAVSQQTETKTETETGAE